MLALPAPACDDDKVAVVACKLCLRTRRVEPAGHSFHWEHERPKLQARRRGKDDGASKAQEASDDEAQHADSWRKKKKQGGEKRGALKLSPLMVGEDLYKLLDISETASTEQIKKQYRKLALQHHPDKQGKAEDDSPSKGKDQAASAGLKEQDKIFIKIQEAYEILSDEKMRRQYDSTLDFDESLPEEVDEKLGFFETFGLAFRRNARWSTRLPVPEIGNADTDILKVHKFYDFWFNFETWRDFSMNDEYNLEDADCREERRWMERQNQTERKKLDQAERRRIMRLAETAERLDPRIRAEREERENKKREEKERRARLKQEELDAKQREEEEKKQREEQEKADQAEKERLEREQKKQDKQVAKTLRQRFKKSVQEKCKLSSGEMDELQDFCLALEAEQLQRLCERLEGLARGAKSEEMVRQELSQAKLRSVEEQEAQARQREEARKRDEKKAAEAKEALSSGSPWSTEELGVLAKGLQKFPGGMGGRWSLITKLLADSGYPRTEKQVLEKTKELSDGQSLRSMGAKVAMENTFQAGNAAAKAASAKPKAAAAAEPKSEAKAKEGSSPASATEWSAEQQQALEKALQRHPATLDKNERWKLIAEDVPGKTKGECVARFKFLREQVAKAKS